MTVSLSRHQLAFIFGLLGNIISFLVFLSPLPAFYTMYKKKSSEGFQSIPYVVALSSAMLFLYYGVLKSIVLIITINTIGCALETGYLIFYLIYAPPKEKKLTMMLILLLDVGAMGLVFFITYCLIKGPKRLTAVSWICLVYNIATFTAPMCIVGRVIKTKSVEFMPFTLSVFHTLCATAWFFYGIFIKDLVIATPNILGFIFGIIQMSLYFIYEGWKSNETKTKQLEEGQCKQVSLGSVESKDNVNQPDDVKESNGSSV